MGAQRMTTKMVRVPNLIGITGYARHGKDSVAAVLKEEMGFEQYMLATQMKQALYILNPLVQTGVGVVRVAELVDLEGWEGAKRVPEVRLMLQRLGTNVGRNLLGEDTWIDALTKSIKGFYASERRMVISDVRFSNEAAWIRRMRGEVWKVIRINPDGSDFDNGVGIDHESERGIAQIWPDYTFVASDIDFLQRTVREYLAARTHRANFQLDIHEPGEFAEVDE